jgi:putative YhbY family RNA-binding protein
MAELQIDKNERLALRAQAHALDPVVLLGNAGLSEAVFKEIDRALSAHGLIKVRIPLDDRDQREDLYTAIADRLGAARVQTIGKLVVLYRPLPEEPPEAEAPKPGTGRKQHTPTRTSRRPARQT